MNRKLPWPGTVTRAKSIMLPTPPLLVSCIGITSDVTSVLILVTVSLVAPALVRVKYAAATSGDAGRGT